MRRSSCSAVEQQNTRILMRDSPAETMIAMENEQREAPTWAAFRSKMLNFTRKISGNPGYMSPGHMSPGSWSPGTQSPSIRSPTNRSPTNRSPASRSPGSKSPTRWMPSLNLRSPTGSGSSPSIRSPASGISTPIRSPTQPYQRNSPISQRNSPTQHQKSSPTQTSQRGSVMSRRGSYVKSSRESFSTSGEGENPPGLNSKSSGNKKKLNKVLKRGLSLEGPEDWNNSNENNTTPSGSGSPGTPVGGRKVKLKLRGSPVEQLLEMTHIDDALSMALASRRPRQGSYHGTTTTPMTAVEQPKRHSFSTSSGTTGIVVSNTDLEFLIRGQNRLTLPGIPLPGSQAPPTQSNPKVRGRSQSIAACAHSVAPDTSTIPGIPGMGPMPITIRRTDCDYIAANKTLEDQEEEEEETNEEELLKAEEAKKKLIWDSSGSTVDVGLLGSAIEKYLKTSNQDDENELSVPGTRLQVK